MKKIFFYIRYQWYCEQWYRNKNSEYNINRKKMMDNLIILWFIAHNIS